MYFSGEGRRIKTLEKFIEAEMVLDWVEPYQSYGSGILKVIQSDHPRFVEGTRLDWGFLSIALEQGYRLFLYGKDLQKWSDDGYNVRP